MTLCDQLHMNWLVSEIDFNSFIHSSMSVLLSCLSVNWSLLIDWLIGLDWKEKRDGKKEWKKKKWHLTDIGWLRIECAVEMKVGWFGWFHFIDWLMILIDE